MRPKNRASFAKLGSYLSSILFKGQRYIINLLASVALPRIDD